MRETKAGIVYSETLGDSQPLPCPWKGFLRLAWVTALPVCWQGSCGTAGHIRAGPALAFLSPWSPSCAARPRNCQAGWFPPALSFPSNAHRGMSPEGSFKRAADSSAPREAVPRTAAYVVGKTSLFLLTPAQHPLFSKAIPPASTDCQQTRLPGELLWLGWAPARQPAEPPESSSGYRASP